MPFSMREMYDLGYFAIIKSPIPFIWFGTFVFIWIVLSKLFTPFVFSYVHIENTKGLLF